MFYLYIRYHCFGSKLVKYSKSLKKVPNWKLKLKLSKNDNLPNLQYTENNYNAISIRNGIKIFSCKGLQSRNVFLYKHLV